MTSWQHIAGADDLHLNLILRAEKLIEPYIAQTPVLNCPVLDREAGARLWFKCESLQKTGAFKFRGACHALLQLTPEQRAAGVFTVSSGNHGAALAHAGQLLGVRVRVAVPHNAPEVKKENIAHFGAEMTEIEPGMAAREAQIARWEAEGSQLYIPPYDHPLIIAGQGTAALELIKAHPELDGLISPLGGGGLLSGTAMVGHSQGIPVWGVEPELAADGKASITANAIQPAMPPISMCDGLLTNLGQHTFPIIRDYVRDILLVSEDEVKYAMHRIWQRLKITAEPSAAVVLAAVLKHRAYFEGQSLGLILSGGNVNLSRLPWQED